MKLSLSFERWLLSLLSISGILLFKPPVYDILLSMTMLYWFIVKGPGIRTWTLAPCLCLTIYVGFYWLSVTRSPNLEGSLWYAGLTTFCAAMWLFYTNVLARYGMPAFHAIMRGYAVTSVVGVVFGFIVYVTQFPGRERLLYNDRPKGLFVDANVFGPSLVVVLLYSFCRIMTGTKRRWLWASVAVLMSAGVFMSFSRGAWVNAAASIIMFLVLLTLSTRSASFLFKRMAVLGLGISLCIGCMYFAFRDKNEFADVARSRSKLQNYDQERFASHDNAIDVVASHPWLGIGPAQYIETFHIATHSLPLHILAENGIGAALGLALFLLLTIVRSALGCRRSGTEEGRIYFCALTALLVATMVNSAVIDTLHWRHVWLLCALAWMPVKQQSAVARNRVMQHLAALIAIQGARPALVQEAR